MGKLSSKTRVSKKETGIIRCDKDSVATLNLCLNCDGWTRLYLDINGFFIPHCDCWKLKTNKNNTFWGPVDNCPYFLEHVVLSQNNGLIIKGLNSIRLLLNFVVNNPAVSVIESKNLKNQQVILTRGNDYSDIAVFNAVSVFHARKEKSDKCLRLLIVFLNFLLEYQLNIGVKFVINDEFEWKELEVEENG